MMAGDPGEVVETILALILRLGGFEPSKRLADRARFGSLL